MLTELYCLKEQWKNSIDGLRIITSQTASSLTLHLIWLPPSKRNQGFGGEIMTELAAYCDRHNLTFTLKPVADYGTGVEALRAFYAKYRFCLGEDGWMRREPLYREEYATIVGNQCSQPKTYV